MMDTGESEHVNWTRWDTISIRRSPLAAPRSPASRSARVARIGFTAPEAEAVVSVLADGGPVTEVGTTCYVPQRVRYIDVRWSRPAEIVELRFSTGCHVSLVAFES